MTTLSTQQLNLKKVYAKNNKIVCYMENIPTHYSSSLK